ncbi:MAG: polyamine aminopropyltransferase [Myxococcales bacterium]|jgi:spermidine synthase
MALWLDEIYGGDVKFGVRVTRSLYHGRSEYQEIDIVDCDKFGRTLALDGVFQTSVEDEHHYHEMLVHPAMLCSKAPLRVLVIGGGDGGTVREVLRHPEVQHVTLCELDEMVTRACQEHLQEMRVPWDDPRLHLRFGDGVAFLRDYDGEPFDVILVDGPDPVGPAEGLYQSPFYDSCKAQLAPGGVFAAQTESPFIMRDDFARIVSTLRNTFAHAAPYLGPVPIYMSSYWSWTFGSDAVGPMDFDPRRAQAIADGSRYYNPDIHRAAFTLPNDVRRLLAG